jgi:hypothetical protein
LEEEKKQVIKTANHVGLDQATTKSDKDIVKDAFQGNINPSMGKRNARHAPEDPQIHFIK